MVSLASLKSWLGITSTTHDAVLPVIEAGVVSELERLTGRLFTSPAASRVDILDGGDPRRVLGGLVSRDVAADLPQIELREAPNDGTLDSLEFRSNSTADWVAEDLADYEVDDRWVYSLAGEFPAGSRNIRATYTFGYAEDDGPADAHLAVLRLVKLAFTGRRMDGVKSAGAGPARITMQDAEKAGVAEIVNRLRRPTTPF